MLRGLLQVSASCEAPLQAILKKCLCTARHPDSSFDVAISGAVPLACLPHSSEILEEMARVLKPNGTLHVCEPVVTRGKHWVV